jgi:glycosyltransferase involved in cell wall biosynthesis
MSLDKQPLVSVLMTVYNREQYIAEAIESVLASTYKNWELIIVDDQSKDKSVEIAQSYSQSDKRIKVYINEQNLGDYPNRNQAAIYAKGKYLKYVDADDMIYPYGLEQLVYYMEQFPEAGYGLCSLVQDIEKIYPFQLTPVETYRRHYFDNKSVFHKAPLSAIIKSDVFKEIGGFAAVRHYGDADMWHRLSHKFKVILMPQGIVWYRFSDGQEAAIRKKNPMNRIKTIHAAHINTTSKYSPLNVGDKSVLNGKFLNQKASAILFGFRKCGWQKGKEMKNYVGFSFLDIFKYKFR